MEFTELDEARRVADLAAKASWRAKEKQRARKKAKLDNGGSSTSAAGQGGGSADGKEGMDTPSGPPPPPPTSTSADLRTGRWTSEETTYCDKLIQKFMGGRLPLPEGIKLNEFLSNMLKSKQSRLTKKMKNAKLSSKTFKRTAGYLTDVLEAREFSECEDGFFHSLQNALERAEIKFHMQKEWRETFSTYCVSHGQPLNVDRWLASVEEMERRVHRAKDVERMQRRKMMMGCALRQDLQNPDRGVVIEKAGGAAAAAAAGAVAAGTQPQAGQYGAADPYAVPDPMVSASVGGDAMASSSSTTSPPPSQTMASPFLHKIMAFIHRHQVPFEYIDAWVPSFVPDADDPPAPEGGTDGKEEKAPKCRLCFAGSMVAKQVIMGGEVAGGAPVQARRAVPLSSDDQFNLSAFGDYSESFSFDVGCGLPGRVYHMGVPTWEQSVHNAPLHHFERVGGSVQWGIRTVVGIPVPSPNVGRVVVVLYSRHDRAKDHDLVIKLTEEFTRLMPSPKWKLVVDVGHQTPQVQQQPPTQTVVTAQAQAGHPPQHQQQAMHQGPSAVHQPPPQAQQQQPQQPQQPQPANQSIDFQQNSGTAPAPPDPAALTSEVISIFGEHMPSDPSNPAFAYLQGFMSLRLLLLRSSRSDHEQDMVNTILSSYSSYKAGGRTRPDIALMLARDFMFLNQQHQPQMQQQHSQARQPQMQMMSQQQQQLNNGQQQFVQQSFAPAPSQMQPQQHQYSPATSSVSGNAPNLMNVMPPPSPHALAGSAKLENSSFNHTNSMFLPQHPQEQHQSQQQGQQPMQQQRELSQQQYHHHQQQPPQQQHHPQQHQQYQQGDSNTNLMSLGDLAPMPQPQDNMTTSVASGDGEEAPPAASEEN